VNAKPGIKKGSHVNLAPEDYIEILHLQSEYPRTEDGDVARIAPNNWPIAGRRPVM
jgi:hypothetical protein